MEKENRNKLIRIISASVLLVGSVLVERTMNLLIWQLLLVYLVPYLVAGYDVLTEAAEDIAHGKGMDEDFLMAIATLGALCIGFMPGAEPQFTEAVFVMLFFQVGELFESFAEGRSRKSISQLMDIRPDIAHVKRGEELVDVNPEEVKVGDIIVIRPGEKVPMDGIVIDGASSLNTVALTGESVPRTIRPTDDIMSGCINLNGVVTAKVTKAFGESTAAKVLNLVENATENKSKNENFITKFAKIYTPIVVVLALLVAVIPPLLINGQLWSVWIYRALTFLVVSCPCALVISVPLTFFGGIGGASRKGVLIKGSNYMETLAKVRTIAFDKTGTMTHGVFDVTAIHPENIAPNELLHLAAHVERYSTHPIALSIRKAFPNQNDGCDVKDVVETAGQGVMARINGKSVSVGNTNLMESVGAKWQPCEKVGTILHIAIDGEYAGHIVVSDKIKEDAADAVNALKAEGVKRLVMLTGDKEEVAADVAKTVGLAEYHAELLPGDKVSQVETILKENAEGTMAFVGDGINDAPVLARADVGIAMGGLGSDAAIEAADVVLMDDKPSKIAVAIRQARRTLRIARENTWFAVGIKIAVLILAFFGLATMWMAVFADVGVTVLAVLNAARTLK
ncbi:cadmium-translocating P-type ATPase [Prevotella histicola]|uniref:heavy metal translocating P-type ATPase n=1 Tax=Prevotella histicola TaxID=470565 RepID=UPI001C603F7C|nr:heavy metal translocating P-type ATPase [Prevotella histicola]MBW4739997.1 cadmium-translocating P-type ATPase [Prevotella histicola]MBW4748278.1 cadmium-translocating P-type ATPase [Prevotella histicola]